MHELKIIAVFVVLLLATGSLFAQMTHWQRMGELDRVLLTRDLGQVIAEAESAPAGDVATLLWRLGLYERAANYEKFALTLRQIPAAPDFEKNRYAISESVKKTLTNEHFGDVKTIQFYLQNIEFNGDIYSKFIQLCTAGRETCDVGGFDDWLGQKALEAADETPTYPGDSPMERWIGLQIDWRQRVGLDTTPLLNPFIEAVRKNPADLETALRYLKYFRTPADISWLAENFASEQASDYHTLGESLANPWGILHNTTRSEDERKQILRVAVRFLQRSLSLPFNEKDKNMVGGRFRYASIPPVIGDYEKQLRYWTNSALAKAYTALGEAQNAQPIVEAIAELDKSDIIIDNPNHLAGAVQMASGARVIESRILREQATRQNSFEYWEERVSYYSGREEPELIFDAYRQALKSVPFNLGDERSRNARLYFIRRFVSFTDDEFGMDGFRDLSNEEKRKAVFWREAEDFLRREFGSTRSNLEYSFALTLLMENDKFEDLLLEILDKNADFLPNVYTRIADPDGDLLYFFLNSETVPNEQKDAVIARIIPLAERAGINNALILCQHILSGQRYAGQVIPILLKNLAKTETRLNSAGPSEENRRGLGSLREKYLETLFRAYLAANNRPAAEKLMLEKYHSSIGDSLDALIFNAIRNRDFGDIVRFWKLKANLNRRDLDLLSSTAQFPEVRDALRAFYERMKKDEPYSPIPAMAMKILDIYQ